MLHDAWLWRPIVWCPKQGSEEAVLSRACWLYQQARRYELWRTLHRIHAYGWEFLDFTCFCHLISLCLVNCGLTLCKMLITVQCYAGRVLAMALCPSVCHTISLSITCRHCIRLMGRFKLVITSSIRPFILILGGFFPPILPCVVRKFGYL